MDKETRKAMAIVSKTKTNDDYVYVLKKKEIRTGWSLVWYTIYHLIPSISNPILLEEKIYLLASQKRGKIIEAENGEIVYRFNVPNWQPDQKENFENVIIGNFFYKKIKKLEC